VTRPFVRLPDERAAIRTLARTFLRRFFDNEITGGSQDLTASFFWLVAFFAGPLALMPAALMTRYRLIVLTEGPNALRLLSRPDKTRFIVFGMMAAAAIAALVWHSLMIERRDGLILGALPVRGRTVVLGKLSALTIYIVGIAAAMHAVSAALYGLVLADHAATWRLALLGPFAHFLAAVMACAFVFLCVTSVHGLALALAGPAAFRRISTILQMLLVAAVIVSFAQVGHVIEGVAAFNQPGHLIAPAPWLLLTPPVWFLGLEEWILGGADPVFAPLAATALIAFTAVAAITVLTYAVAYRRIMVRVVETPEDGGRSGVVSAAADWIARRLSPTPARRAAAQFFFISVGRVERLRFVLAAALGVIGAWLVPAVIALASHGQPPATAATFGLSYAAVALVVVGARIAISMPADLRAAWIVPIIDASGRALRSGLWRALYVAGVAPLVIGFACLHAWLWDWRMAAQHAVVMAAVSALLVELSLWHFDDLPHRRPWRPEHANLRVWWPAYVVGFIALTRTLPRLESAAHETLAGTGAIAATVLAAMACLRFFHHRPYPPPAFDIETFVETPHVLRLE
jgi:hypothetical protein